MAKYKNQDPLAVPDPDIPLQCCITCTHWRSRGELLQRDYLDIAVGRCCQSALQCPPMHSCLGYQNSQSGTIL